METTTVTLSGTDKQVAWATTIRAKGLQAIEDLLTEYEQQCIQHNSPANQVEQGRTLYHGLRDKVAAQTSAAWWIDRRFDTARQLLKAVQ